MDWLIISQWENFYLRSFILEVLNLFRRKHGFLRSPSLKKDFKIPTPLVSRLSMMILNQYLNRGVKRLLWILSLAITIVAVGIWIAIIIDEWNGFVARGGVPGALFVGVLCLITPSALVWGGAALVFWIREGFSQPSNKKK